MALTVSSLHVYPVKGLKGIDLASANCTERGIEHDRRWLVVEPDGAFLTQREHPKMATVWTEIGEALTLSAPDMPVLDIALASPDRPSMKVSIWHSVVDAIPVSRDADAWLTEYLGLACRLVYMPDSTKRYSNPDYAHAKKLVGFADGYAYLVTNEKSLAELNRRMVERGAAAIPMNRFRPNIVLAGAQPFAEDGWREVAAGEVTLRAAKPCGRCQVTTTDQATGQVTGPEPLATLSTFRDSKEFGVMFGVNCVSVRDGILRVGDAVETREAIA